MDIKRGTRFPELDALRGLAALSVALFHYSYGYDISDHGLVPGRFYLSHGNMGVQLFFMISGFVILMTLNKRPQSKTFFISRFSRLYPAYWVAVIMTVGLTTLLSDSNFAGLFSLKQVLVNMTMLSYWVRVKYVDLSYWTLSVELTFYVLMWVMLITRQLSNIRIYTLIWLSIALLFAANLLPFGEVISRVFILKHAPFFAGGIGYYLLINDNKSKFTHVLIFLSGLVSLLVDYKENADMVRLEIIVVLYLVFYLFVFGKLRLVVQKPLIFLGSISYSFYLLHQNIGCALISRLKQWHDVQWLYTSITLLCIGCLAYLLSVCVERPAMQWLRGNMNNK